MACTQTPGCIIDPNLATARIGSFAQKKANVMDGLIGYKTEISSITYSVQVFLQLLNFLTQEPGRFSGLRVYFASYLWSSTDPGSQTYIPTGLEDNLTQIFVPTIATPQSDGTTLNVDDPTNCFIVVHNQLVRLNNPSTTTIRATDTASNWVRYYQSKLLAMNKDGVNVTKNTQFSDTKSIWYNIEMFLDNSTRIGLISYINCLVASSNPVISIIAMMACYQNTDVLNGFQLNYQMTVVYMLHQQNATTPLFFGTTGSGFGVEGSTDKMERKHHFVSDPPSDTGLPCPPDTGCIGGGLLPQS